MGLPSERSQMGLLHNSPYVDPFGTLVVGGAPALIPWFPVALPARPLFLLLRLLRRRLRSPLLRLQLQVVRLGASRLAEHGGYSFSLGVPSSYG